MAQHNYITSSQKANLMQYLDDILFCSCVFPSSTSIHTFEMIAAHNDTSTEFYDVKKITYTDDYITGFAKVALIHIALFNDQPKMPNGFAYLCAEPGMADAIIWYMMMYFIKTAKAISPDARIPTKETLNVYLPQFCKFVVGVYNRQHIFGSSLLDFPTSVGPISGLPLLPGIQLNDAHAMLSVMTGGRFTITLKQASRAVKIDDTVIAVDVNCADAGGATITGYVITGRTAISKLAPVLVIVLDNIKLCEEMLQYLQSYYLTRTKVAYIGGLYRAGIQFLKSGKLPAASIGEINVDSNTIDMKSLDALPLAVNGNEDLSDILLNLENNTDTDNLIEWRNVELRSSHFPSYLALTQTSTQYWSASHTLYAIAGAYHVACALGSSRPPNDTMKKNPSAMWTSLINNCIRSEHADSGDLKAEITTFIHDCEIDSLWWALPGSPAPSHRQLSTINQIMGTLLSADPDVHDDMSLQGITEIMESCNCNGFGYTYVVEKKNERHFVVLKPLPNIRSFDSVIYDSTMMKTKLSIFSPDIDEGSLSSVLFDEGWWSGVELV